MSNDTDKIDNTESTTGEKQEQLIQDAVAWFQQAMCTADFETEFRSLLARFLSENAPTESVSARTQAIRDAQRSGGGEVTAVMVSPEVNDECVACGHSTIKHESRYGCEEIIGDNEWRSVYCKCVFISAPTESTEEVEGQASFADYLPLSPRRIAAGEWEIVGANGHRVCYIEGAAITEWLCARANAEQCKLNNSLPESH